MAIIMGDEWTKTIVLAIFVFGFFGFFGVRALLFLKKYNKILVGMSYDEVEELLGPPKNIESKDDITTCIWTLRVLRDVRITRIIVFKGDKVFSFLSGRR